MLRDFSLEERVARWNLILDPQAPVEHGEAFERIVQRLALAPPEKVVRPFDRFFERNFEQTFTPRG